MTPTEPLPTGPAFSARLHAALGILGVNVTTPEDRHGAWLLGLERAADQIQNGTTGLHAWTVARDVVQHSSQDPDIDEDTRKVLAALTTELTESIEDMQAGREPVLDVQDIAFALYTLTFAVGEAQEHGEDIAGHSPLALLLAHAHLSITLNCTHTIHLPEAPTA